MENNGAIKWFCAHLNGLWPLEAWKMIAASERTATALVLVLFLML